MSTTEYSPVIYTGTLEQVLDDIIAAKAQGHDVHVARTPGGDYVASAVPTRTVQARFINEPQATPSVSATHRSILGLRIHNPIALGIVLLLGLALAVTVLVCIAIGLMGVVTWVKANAAMVGGVLIAIVFVIVFFTALILKARGQQPIHINNYTNEA
jgi:hypothetical protein